MKRLKLLLEYIKLKHKGYTKEERYFKYAIKGLITFEEYVHDRPGKAARYFGIYSAFSFGFLIILTTIMALAR